MSGRAELNGSPEKTGRSPVNTGRKQGTRFQKGQSGNPQGRPPGARNRTTVAMEALLDDEAETILRTVIGKAKEGDTTALRLCLERVVPVRRERCIQFAFPPIETAADAAKAAAALVTGVANGELTPAEAGELGRLIDNFVRALEASEFDARLRRLEGGTP
jgi:hypothetical protein